MDNSRRNPGSALGISQQTQWKILFKILFIGYCPEDYTLYSAGGMWRDSRCYKFHRDGPENFYEAEAECSRQPDGHLASYQTKQQLDFLIYNLVPGCVAFTYF